MMRFCPVDLKIPLLLVACSAFVLAPQSASAQCTQTLSVGANIAAAVSSAANGSTICLNSGNYGSVPLSNITRTGFVTLRSTSGTEARISSQITNTDYVRFRNMTLTSVRVQSCSTHIEFVDSVFLAGGPGLYFTEGEGASCGPQVLLVDNVSFAGVNFGGNEGRLGTQGAVNGLTIRNSFFGNNGYGDGIQIGGGTNIVIGPNNIFDGISQPFCNANGGAHCDAIQIFCGFAPNADCYEAGSDAIRITGNWFKNSQTHIMAPDGSSNVIVEFNVFDMTGTSYIQPVQFGSATNAIFRHNTVRGIAGSTINFDNKSGLPGSTGVLSENNILHGAGFKLNCTSCSFRFNLFGSSGSATGTNNVIGTPIYVGGTAPSTWTGWALAAGSPGKNAGNDGLDMGANIQGSAPTPPAAPTGLRVVP
jgi:hypothetical protein